MRLSGAAADEHWHPLREATVPQRSRRQGGEPVSLLPAAHVLLRRLPRLACRERREAHQRAPQGLETGVSTTNIEWADRVWNPVTGCTKVSPGCKHCYAEGVAHRFWATQYPQVPVATRADLDATNTFHRARRFTDVMTHEDRLLEPLSWKKPQRIFVNSMSDLFHEDVPDAFIDQVFAVMALAPRHTFQVLTKRPGRMNAYVKSLCRGARSTGRATRDMFDPDGLYLADANEKVFHVTNAPKPLQNVWLGVSVEDQQRSDERIPLLLQTPAAVRFISAEPLLGSVNLAQFVFAECHGCGTVKAACDGLRANRQACCPDCRHRRLDWVISGGESGTGARPCDVAWIRSIVTQCQAAGVPVFVKQLGAKPECGSCLDPTVCWCGEQLQRVTNRKGGDAAEWPADLRVREFPR